MQNPIRRNKNIGKTQGGRVKHGEPKEKRSRIFTQDIWTKLSESPDRLQFITENPSRDYYHPCTQEDYLKLMKHHLPKKQTKALKAILLRRTPKRDERFGVEARMRYRCIIINAFPCSNEMLWFKRPTKATIRHYAAWCQNWIEEDGVFKLIWSVEEIRHYYLYHLFLHELGHINQPWFHAQRRREEFAENYALSWARKLKKLQLIDTSEESLYHIPSIGRKPPEQASVE